MSGIVPFVDLRPQWDEIETACMLEFPSFFQNSQFSLGYFVERFERSFADFMGVKHAVGVNSGTSALHLALLAAGIKPGDRVLLPAHTFIATAWAPIYVGAEIVLCDVDEATGTIDLDDAAKRLRGNASAIIPVHLYGQPANMGRVTAFAEDHGLAVIEDASQAHGVTWDGQRIGGLGNFGCFSFYPGKNLGAPGEAGMVVTNDEGHAESIRSLRNHGQRQRYLHERIGYNYRMEGFNGLVLHHKLACLMSWTAARKAIAQTYLKEFADLPLKLPHVLNQDHVYHLFVVRTERRDALRKFLEDNGVQTGLHYPVPLHRQPCLAHLNFESSAFPVSDKWADQGLSLPIFPGMTEQQVGRVVEATVHFFKS